MEVHRRRAATALAKPDDRGRPDEFLRLGVFPDQETLGGPRLRGVALHNPLILHGAS